MISPTILITRPYDDAILLARKLKALHYNPLIDSLLSIQKLKLEPLPLPLDKIQACILTSRNAAFALHDYHIPLYIPIYVVGKTTAAVVEEMGYQNIIVGEGMAVSLIPLLQADLRLGQGPVIHFCGSEIRYDFSIPLAKAGLECRKVIAYQTLAVDRLKPETVLAFQKQQIAAVLFYSPKTARCFDQVALELRNYLKGVKAVCLSQDIANAVQLPFAKVVAALIPDEEALLETLESKVRND